MAETSVYLDQELIDDVEAIAHERSSPGDSVSRSKVVREAIREYVERRRSGSDVGDGDPPDEVPADA